MWESIVTIAIVLAILLLALRSLYRTIKGEKPACSCGAAGSTCGGCASKPEPYVNIQPKRAR